MRVLIVGGNVMQVGDGSRYWSMRAMLEAAGHDVRLRECIQTGSSTPTSLESKVTAEDLAWAKDGAVIVYSYGAASVWKLWQSMASAAYKLLIVVAGVPDFWLSQFYAWLWHAPAFVERAVCFDVKDTPISCTLQNDEAADISFGMAMPAARHVNVHCDNLFPTFGLPAAKHTGIKEKEIVLAEIVKLVG